MTYDEIIDTKDNVKGLCKLAREIGYQDPCFQLQNSDGSVVGDLLYFFDDNPGACSAVIQWIADQYAEEDSECEYCGEPTCLGCEDASDSPV
jgi:hypothetical protein